MDEPRFIRGHALVVTDSIGRRTHIWAFAHIVPGAVIGATGEVCDHTYIEEDVIIGDRGRLAIPFPNAR